LKVFEMYEKLNFKGVVKGCKFKFEKEEGDDAPGGVKPRL